jgi:hypothetical protein
VNPIFVFRFIGIHKFFFFENKITVNKLLYGD